MLLRGVQSSRYGALLQSGLYVLLQRNVVSCTLVAPMEILVLVPVPGTIPTTGALLYTSAGRFLGPSSESACLVSSGEHVSACVIRLQKMVFPDQESSRYGFYCANGFYHACL